MPQVLGYVVSWKRSPVGEIRELHLDVAALVVNRGFNVLPDKLICDGYQVGEMRRLITAQIGTAFLLTLYHNFPFRYADSLTRGLFDSIRRTFGQTPVESDISVTPFAADCGWAIKDPTRMALAVARARYSLRDEMRKLGAKV